MELLRLTLLPLSAVYYLIIAIKNFLYDNNILRSRKFTTPVICIGNISSGGTGKTPVILSLAEHIINKGFIPAIISRGYKRTTTGFRKVDIVDHEQFGDEPAMLLRNLRTKNIFVSEDRVAGITRIINEEKPDFILMDDGFQNRKIEKHLNIVLVNRTKTNLIEKITLPAGNLRETSSALKRSDIIINNYKFNDISKDAQLLPDDFSMLYRVKGFFDINENQILNEEISKNKYIGLCGIASPGNFFDSLRKHGISLAAELSFSDHHSYSKKEIEKIIYLSEDSECKNIMTTEKDMIRLIKHSEHFANNNVKCVYMKIEAEIQNIDTLMESIFKLRKN